MKFTTVATAVVFVLAATVHAESTKRPIVPSGVPGHSSLTDFPSSLTATLPPETDKPSTTTAAVTSPTGGTAQPQTSTLPQTSTPSVTTATTPIGTTTPTVVAPTVTSSTTTRPTTTSGTTTAAASSPAATTTQSSNAISTIRIPVAAMAATVFATALAMWM